MKKSLLYVVLGGCVVAIVALVMTTRRIPVNGKPGEWPSYLEYKGLYNVSAVPSLRWSLSSVGANDELVPIEGELQAVVSNNPHARPLGWKEFQTVRQKAMQCLEKHCETPWIADGLQDRTLGLEINFSEISESLVRELQTEVLREHPDWRMLISAEVDEHWIVIYPGCVRAGRYWDDALQRIVEAEIELRYQKYGYKRRQDAYLQELCHANVERFKDVAKRHDCELVCAFDRTYEGRHCLWFVTSQKVADSLKFVSGPPRWRGASGKRWQLFDSGRIVPSHHSPPALSDPPEDSAVLKKLFLDPAAGSKIELCDESNRRFHFEIPEIITDDVLMKKYPTKDLPNVDPYAIR